MGEVVFYNQKNEAIAKGQYASDDTPRGISELEVHATTIADLSGKQLTVQELRALGAKTWKFTDGTWTSRSNTFDDFVKLFEKYNSAIVVLDQKKIKAKINEVPEKDRAAHPLKPLLALGPQIILSITVDNNPNDVSVEEAESFFAQIEKRYGSGIVEALRVMNPDVRITGVTKKLDRLQEMVNERERNKERSASEGEGVGAAADQGIEAAQSLLDRPVKWDNLLKSEEGMVAMVKTLRSRFQSLIALLRMLLAGGDTDLIAMLEELEAGVARLQSNETALMASFRKDKLDNQIVDLRELYFKYMRLAADAESRARGKNSPDEMTKANEYKELAERASNNIPLIDSLKKSLDGLIQSAMSMAQEAAEMARTTRYLRDRNKTG